jgi:beta-lactamase regulating signal transducer with metallopeptidase domain
MWPFDTLCDPTWRPLTATLLHFVWQGMLVAGAWMVLFRCFRNSRTQTQYLLGLAGLLAMTACPIATLVLLRSDARPAAAPATRVLTVPNISPAAAQAAPRRTDLSLRQAAVSWIDASQPYLIGGWLLGLAILSGRLLLGAVSARRLRRGRRPVSAELAGRAAALAARLGLRVVPGIFVSDVVCDAVVTGVLRPIILLPAAWLLEMTPEVLEAVIAHELAHIRRLDPWVNLFQRLVETVLFYHPGVWWLSHRVRVAREMCCDELAVAATGQRVVYATALEFAAQRRLAPARPFLEVALGATQMTLLDRVRNVLGLSTSEKKGRWWLTALWAILVIGAIGLAVTAAGRERYTARSYLRVAMQEKPIAFQSDNQTVDRDRFEIYKNTQQQLVISRFVLLAALRKREVVMLPSVLQAQKAGDAARWLGRRLSVGFPGKAEIMEVSVSSNDPQEAAILDRAVVDAYLSEVVNAERDLKRQRFSELDRACVEKETEVRSKREDLKQLAERLGVSDTEALTMRQKLQLEELALYRQELAKNQSELRRLRSELAAQQTLLKGIDALNMDDEVELATQVDPVARQLFLELGWRKLSQRDAEETPGGADKPDRAERLQKDIKKLQAAFDAREATMREIVRKKKQLAVRTEIKRLETAIATMTEQAREQQKMVDEREKEARDFGRSTVEVEMMRADIKNLELVLTAIATEREKLRVEIRATPRITLIQRADVPESPD